MTYHDRNLCCKSDRYHPWWSRGTHLGQEKFFVHIVFVCSNDFPLDLTIRPLVSKDGSL